MDKRTLIWKANAEINEMNLAKCGKVHAAKDIAGVVLQKGRMEKLEQKTRFADLFRKPYVFVKLYSHWIAGYAVKATRPQLGA